MNTTTVDFNQFRIHIYKPENINLKGHDNIIRDYLRNRTCTSPFCLYLFGLIKNRITLLYKLIYTYIPQDKYYKYDLLFKVQDVVIWKREDIDWRNIDMIMKYAIILEFPSKLMEFNTQDTIKVDDNFFISYLVDMETKDVKIDGYYNRKDSEYNLMAEINDISKRSGGLIYPIVDVIYLYVDGNNELVISNDLYKNDKYILDFMKYNHRIYIIFGIK